jgi:hypothetical protein
MLPYRTAVVVYLTATALLFTVGCSDSNAPPAEVVTPYTMQFEEEQLNLDTGVKTACGLGGPSCPAGVDFNIAYNSQRPVHAVVFQHSGLQIAHLRGASFGAVHAADTVSAGFTTSLIDEPFDNTRVILIRTDANKIYKLGNPAETATTVAFDTAPLN